MENYLTKYRVIYKSFIYCVAACCSVLQHVAVRYSVLQHPTEYRIMFYAHHGWSGEALKHLLGATKCAFSTSQFRSICLETSPKYSETQSIARDFYSNELTSEDPEYTLCVYYISSSNFKPSPLYPWSHSFNVLQHVAVRCSVWLSTATHY